MEDGLPAGHVTDIAQTSDGFLWITSSAGLVRSDGNEMRRWGENSYDGLLNYVRVGPADRLVTGLIEHAAYDVLPDGLRIIKGPDSGQASHFRYCNYDQEGNLWCTFDRSLVRRAPDGRWYEVNPESLDSETPEDLVCLKKSEILLWTREGGLWTVDSSGSTRKVLHEPFALVHAFALGKDDYVYAEKLDPPYQVIVKRWNKGQVTELVRNDDRIIDIEERSGTLWTSFVNRVVLIPLSDAIGRPSRLEGLDSGARMAVDNEGGLWIGTFTGLVQLPEPDTRTWNVHHGLPSSFYRSIAGTGDEVWVASWYGLVRARREEGELRVSPFNAVQTSRICADSADGIWVRQPDEDGAFRLWRIGRRSVSGHGPVSDERFEFSCSLAGDGSLWMTTNRDVWRVAPLFTEPDHLTIIDEPLPRPTGILADRSGNLWIHGPSETICRGSVVELLQTRATTWSCEEVGRGSEVRQLAETPKGEIWAATLTGGVLKRTEEGWITVLDSEQLGGRWVEHLQPSRWGGMWTSGAGFVKRFDEIDGRWSVVEAPTSWHGAPLSVARGVYEDDDDNLWVASVKGVTFIPARVRRLRLPAPRIYLVSARVGGEDVGARDAIQVRKRSDLVELRFAALSYREPGRLRYRIRWNDGTWTESRTSEIRAAGLSSGTYRVEAAATIDGENWSKPTAVVSFFVPKPWYLRWWALGLACLLIGTIAYTLYKVRLLYHLGLERQRTQIAMDLHDELGSGLATINVLADIAAHEHVTQRKRTALENEIAESASTLGRSLTDLVWALRQDSSTLDALMSHLSERASQLFADGKPELRVSFPPRIPPEPLTLAVRRNIQMIVLEALNNVKKHAKAHEVELGLSRDARRWQLWIRDDGLGNRSTNVDSGLGLGLSSMRQRAEQIGAELDWIQDASGTRVALRFSPRALKMEHGSLFRRS